ncbi:hypothetical protein D3C81_2013380 [compost metagenome]
MQFVEGARCGALQPAVGTPVAAPRQHHVIAVAPVLQEGRQQFGRVLQVGIHGDHHVAARFVQPGCQRRLLAEIARQVDHHHA